MKIYKQIKCSDRLPSESGIYLTNLGAQHYISHYISRWVNVEPQWWMQEIGLETPSDILIEGVKQGYTSENLYLDVFINGANFILNKIKNG